MPMLLTKWTFALISVNSLSTVLFVHALVHRKSTGDHHHHNPQSLLDNPKDDIHTEAAKMQAQASENQAPMSCPDGYKIEADDAKYLTCPPGRYLTYQSREKARERLFNAVCFAKSLGQGGNVRETDSYKTRGYATFESSIWPKPKTCQQLPHEYWINGPHPYRPDDPPPHMTKLVNMKVGAEFHRNLKVASTSFQSYLKCALGEDWESLPVSSETPERTKVVTAVRDPIDRWISAVGELLERTINHICPSYRPCSVEKDSFDMSTTLPDLRHKTTWYKVIEAGFQNAKLDELVAAFVHDTQCNFHYYSAEHFSTQTLMTQNNGTAQDQDLLIKLEDSEDGLKRFHEIFGGNAECKLEHLNAAAKKTGEHKIPDRNDILHKLQGNDELMRALCAVYAQDFICFSYDLPRACKGMF
mmetsp:Transcript_137734/g.242856  ORF Transcript_137734/g.242856 Transcript_137734/m.242856 type:complete len:415 (+) Transcript_137734:129-1373(+)